ncbi:hypothetical protein [Dyadobacter frigoris]|uniref:hypothetical protein n=1 Tax=Dyadobacter frigoris TaxID=2576211 RepID=UPI0014857142
MKNVYLTVIFLLCKAALHARRHRRRKFFAPGQPRALFRQRSELSNNSNFQDVTIQGIHNEIIARGIVLDDSQTKLAIVVSDLCMVSREIIDGAKRRASEITKIPVSNMLISATHTHSGGTACAFFQSTLNKRLKFGEMNTTLFVCIVHLVA